MRIIAMALVIVLGAGVSAAQAPANPHRSNENWIGVWQGLLDGQPGVIITIAERDGRLDGTVVFNIVSREPQPHVLASEPQMLLSPRIDGDTLHFKVNAFPGRPDLEYDVKTTGRNAAHLKCLNCDGSPEADLVRAPVHPAKE
jgi:hypothetical protein